METSESLRSAYKNTTYQVTEPSLSIRIGETNQDLDDLLSKYNATEWCFITAFNPRSEILTDDANISRNEDLEAYLTSEDYPIFKGYGVPDSGDWQPEASFLALGVSKTTALSLCEKFEQHAVVIGTRGMPAELLFAQKG